MSANRVTDRFSRILVCTVFVCLTIPSFAQVAIDVWNADNGLPQNTVRAICQTPDGYLWLTTFDGLVRFDGVRFTVYNRSNTPGINGNRFVSLFCTGDGDLWAGTVGSGVTYYHRGKFSTYTTQHGLPSNNVLGISGDDHGNVWTLAHGRLTEWQAATQRFVPRSGDENWYADSLTPDGRTGFWRIDRAALHVFARGRQFQSALPGGWHNTAGAKAGADVSGKICLADGTGKLVRLVDNRWVPLPSRTDYRDAHGNLWHTEMTWNPELGFVRYIVLPPDNQPGRIAFNALFEDRDGNIWLSTEDHGLYRLHTQVIHVYSKEQGLPARKVYPICKGRDETLWIGTWFGGLARFRDGKFTNYTTADGLASDQINAIGEDRDGTLWVAVPHGLHRFRKGRFESASSVFDPEDVTVTAIYHDRQGVMWFGTNYGLIYLDKGHPKRLTKNDGLATDDVRVLLDGRNGGLWIGGYGGLSCIRNGQLRAWTAQNGLASNAIRALYEDSDGVLWIGSYDGGLTRMENGVFTRYTVLDGLFSNGVFQILEDSRGNLWMSCNQGIYRVSKKQLNDFAAGKTRRITSIHYGKHDGMRSTECNGGFSPAGVKTSDGRLWFPSQDGVVVLDPEKLAGNPRPPPVVIESCLIDRAPVPIDRPVQVKRAPDSLEIEYTALSLTDSEHIQFRYQMQGVDRDWVEATTRRTAYYPHLPPGSYVFKVTAAHGDGAWNQSGANLALIVLPAFYQTWWFELLLFAAGAAILWFGWQYRVTQLDRARAAQQAFSRQLIASQENERKRIAAELHDSLGQRLVIIKNLALLMLQNRGNSSALDGTERRQVEEISAEASSAFREVREIAYDLRPYRLDRLGLTAALHAMIETASAASLIPIAVEIDNIDDIFPKPAEINFYRIVQECVSNILKHSQAAAASVRIRRTPEGLTLAVRDDGKGFVQNPSSPGSPAGFGLTGISERAQLLGGKTSIQSAPGQGTTVTIEIIRGVEP